MGSTRGSSHISQGSGSASDWSSEGDCGGVPQDFGPGAALSCDLSCSMVRVGADPICVCVRRDTPPRAPAPVRGARRPQKRQAHPDCGAFPTRAREFPPFAGLPLSPKGKRFSQTDSHVFGPPKVLRPNRAAWACSAQGLQSIPFGTRKPCTGPKGVCVPSPLRHRLRSPSAPRLQWGTAAAAAEIDFCGSTSTDGGTS
jgi:hypothetical protein